MLKNYIKIAWRNLLKDPQFTLLNLVGLSTGLACSLLIWLWVTDELNVDKYNKNDQRIYQVMANVKTEDGIRTMSSTPGLLGEALNGSIPEIGRSVSILPASWFSSQGIITTGENKIKAAGEYVSNGYFDVFTLNYIQGNKEQLFAGTNSIAISRDLAIKIFGTTQEVVGKTINWDQWEFSGPFTISGIFEKTPPNATEQFDVLLNYDLVLEKRPYLLNWGNSDPNTYVLLKEDANISNVNSKITDLIQSKHTEKNKASFLVRYSDRYLYGKYENGIQSGGRITYVKLFSLIAVVILIIACINFMNLSTAKSSRRIKEVGIKKVSGASRIELVLQYLGESLLMTFLSLIFAFLLIFLMLPFFNHLAGKQLSLQFDLSLILSILGITILTGLISGSYPAFYLSGFSPAAVLKGKLKTAVAEVLIRKGLVIFQFALSVIFIATVLIVYRQINYIQSKDLGYDRDHLIHFEIPLENDEAKLNAAASFVSELKSIPGVITAGSYSHNLTGDHGEIGGFQWPGKEPGKDINFANLEVGSNFLETAGIKIIEGRSFSPGINAINEIVFNQSAIKQMGLKDPIGKTVKFWDQTRTIVGIAKDFNFESLYATVKPAFFQVYPVMPNILVRIRAGMEKQTIERIRNSYMQFSPGMDFDYKFLDQDYQALYTSELRIGILSRYFAALAIIISCLGLFGLAAFTAQKRQKEIGIRKVIGATVSNIVLMLSGDFIKLIIASMLVAAPIAYYMIHKWLDAFAYRTDVPWWLFIVIGSLVLPIAFVTISFQAVKAALANPVNSLRAE